MTYNSLLLKRRKEMHERVGIGIKRLYADYLDEFYETLAQHFSRGEDTEKAVTYLKLAGDKARFEHSMWEAVIFYREALRLLDSLPENVERERDKLDVYHLIWNPIMFLNYPEGSLDLLQEAERLAEGLGDDASLAKIYNRLSMYHTWLGKLSTGIEYSEKSIDVAEKMGDAELMATASVEVCTYHFYAGGYVKVCDLARRAIELLEKQHRKEAAYTAELTSFTALSGWWGMALGMLGEFEEAKTVLQKGLENSLEDRLPVGMMWPVNCSLPAHYNSGDTQNLIDNARENIEQLEKIGFRVLLCVGWSFLGAGYHFLAEYETARDYAEKGLKIQREAGAPVNLPFCLHVLSMILTGLGDFENARMHTEEALDFSRELKLRGWEATECLALGNILGKGDQPQLDNANKHLRRGIVMAEEMQMKPSVAQGYLFLGEVFDIASRRGEALENLRKAEQMYQEMKVPSDSYWLARTREALARLEQD